MDFKRGQKVRPKEITTNGRVIFERYDSTGALVSVMPNQFQCETYGYFYNVQTGTCTAYDMNITPLFDANTKNNTNIGVNNVIASDATNTLLVGRNNNAQGNGRNNIAVGSNNQIDFNVNNGSAFGTNAEVTASNTMVLGGNNGSDIIGKRQAVEVMYGVKTTNGNNTTSYLNNTPDSYFQIPRNSAFYFEATIIAVRSGGTNPTGAIGDFASWTEIGVARSLYDTATSTDILTIKRTRKDYSDDGSVSNWQPTAILPAEGFSIRCRGEVDCIIDWTINVKLTQIKLEDETPCPEQECPESWFWVQENCRCQQCQEQICAPGQTFNYTTCECEGEPDPCPEEPPFPCPDGTRWDRERCECLPTEEEEEPRETPNPKPVEQPKE